MALFSNICNLKNQEKVLLIPLNDPPQRLTKRKERKRQREQLNAEVPFFSCIQDFASDSRVSSGKLSSMEEGLIWRHCAEQNKVNIIERHVES